MKDIIEYCTKAIIKEVKPGSKRSKSGRIYLHRKYAGQEVAVIFGVREGSVVMSFDATANLRKISVQGEAVERATVRPANHSIKRGFCVNGLIQVNKDYIGHKVLILIGAKAESDEKKPNFVPEPTT